MSMIVKKLYESSINFPADSGKILIEDNVGDKFPIHVHFGYQKGKQWVIRLHFTYDEFNDICKKMTEMGRWEK
jgi:hypothetical protein